MRHACLASIIIGHSRRSSLRASITQKLLRLACDVDAHGVRPPLEAATNCVMAPLWYVALYPSRRRRSVQSFESSVTSSRTAFPSTWVRDAVHVPTFEQPAWVNPRVLRFLS